VDDNIKTGSKATRKGIHFDFRWAVLPTDSYRNGFLESDRCGYSTHTPHSHILLSVLDRMAQGM